MGGTTNQYFSSAFISFSQINKNLKNNKEKDKKYKIENICLLIYCLFIYYSLKNNSNPLFHKSDFQ